jgi:hypothetical protein
MPASIWLALFKVNLAVASPTISFAPAAIGDPTRTNAMTTGSGLAKRFVNSSRARLFRVLGALAVTAFVAGGADATAPRIDESQLLEQGFKVLVATNKVQEDWVRNLPAGQIRPMQRTGKKYFIYPDASRKQIYVGGPKEYEAYVQLHPERGVNAQEAAKKASAYRGKQDAAMQKATARDLSDPFLGVTWADLGW